MDALGRETNVIVRCCKVEGGAVNPSYNCRGWKSHETTRYPDGVSDYSVAVDARGLETTSFSTSFESCEELVSSNANKTTTVLSYRNGGTVTREDWAGGLWKETELVVGCDDDGCKVETTTVTSSDHDCVETRRVIRDFLGRVVREISANTDITYTYEGAGSRVFQTVDAKSGVTRIKLYNSCGEGVGERINGISSKSETRYEQGTNGLWRVTTQERTGQVTNVCTVLKERLTGLSDALRSEIETYRRGVLVSRQTSSFDPETLILTEVEDDALSGRTETQSKFGRVITTTTSSGTVNGFFDAYGRVFYSEKDGRSVYWIGRNDFGDVEEYDVFHASGDSVYADFYGYDVFGNRISATNALGSVTSTSFDADNRPSSASGATYPLRQGYDAEGRRTKLSTTRDGQVWDETHWTYDAASGLCTGKRYADDSIVAYTHTQDGKPLRTTFHSGRWSENEYNAKRERTAVRFSGGGTDTFVYDEFSQEIVASNAVAAVALLRADDGAITNELWRIGIEERTLERASDPFGRVSANDGAVYSYAEDGRLAAIMTSDATVSYSYAADREDAGYVLTLANGVSFVRTVTRDPYRRSLVTGISNRANGVEIESLAYTYDALNRPILRNADSFGYNTCSEVTSATIGGCSSSYDYDEIGNSTTYAANSLNQYTAFGYDADGNLLSDGYYTYAYDAANRLKRVQLGDWVVLENDYDAKSRRVRKVTPEATTTYFYDDWNLIEERIANENGTNTVIRYTWGKDLSGSLQGAGGVGGLLYLTVDGSVYVPLYDNNGNITHYCDATGAVVAAYTYDAFGNTITQSGDLAYFFRHRFSTKYYDTESGLYYYGYRFYHPTLMRWLNRDPIEEDGGVNLYGFCKNSPVSLYDNFGLFTIHIHTEGVGHVGIMTKEGVAYDYGRYFGKYSTGLTGKMDQAGPNILIRGSGPSNKHSYTRYKFSVCPLVDKKVTEELNKQFASGAKGLPSDVIARYDVAPKIPLADNMRYMGSDWSINNNCQTFTFRAIANAARAVGEDKNATRLERQQATAMISLSFLSCWQPAPVAVKKMLSGFAKDSKWITEER